MVFSSVPAYLDPSNWQPQINHQGIGSTAPNQPPQQQHAGSGSGSGSTRPGSMTERARLANIPMPEAALKCPRCESTNTKFCYFNNYNLSQPRHFCKTCRRYWTRGGALRTVPVGGGCRRNKRTKSSSAAASKSSLASASENSSNNSKNISGQTANPGPPGGGDFCNDGYLGNLLNLTQPFQPLRFTSPLSQLGENPDVGLNNLYTGGGMDQMAGFQVGTTASLLGIEPWRLQQFPLLGSMDHPLPATNYQFGGGGELGFLGSGGGGELRPSGKMSAGSLLSQMAAVKMEEQNPNLRPSRGLLSEIQATEHQWNMDAAGSGGANWTELSSFSSSSNHHPLQ